MSHNRLSTTANTDRILLSIDEVAEITGLSRSTIRRQIKAGKLPCKRVGRRVVVCRHDLDLWCLGTLAR